MKAFPRIVIGLLVVVMAFFSMDSPTFGQSKFLRWFRERIGERKAKEAQKADANAKWQKEHFADADAQQRFISAFKKARCYVCHVKKKKKKVRNGFGQQLSENLQSRLKMNSKQIAAAIKSSAPEEQRNKVEDAFYLCLDKALEAPLDPEKKESETFGDRLKQGELPAP